MTSTKLSLAIALTTAGIASACAAPTGSSSQPAEDTERETSALAYDQSAALWTATDGVIPICWETPGFEQEKAWAQNAATQQWEQAARLTFTGWGDCPTAGSAQYVKFAIVDGHYPTVGYAETEGRGMALLRSPTDRKASEVLLLSRAYPPTQALVENITLHALGHVLGFVDESDRSDAPAPGSPDYCDYTRGVGGPVGNVTPYDASSIMNPCHPTFGTQGFLSPLDILGVQAIYGRRGPACTTALACPSTYGPQVMTVSCASTADFYLADSNGHYFEETSTSFSTQTSLDQGFSILACAPGETTYCTTLSTYAPASSWCGKTTCPKGTHWCGADEGCLSACD